MAGIPSLEECRPGLRATGFNLVVAVAPPEKMRGLIHLPDAHVDREKILGVQGRIVSISPVAFDFAHFPAGTAPRVGDAIQFAKLSGTMALGADGREYRMLQDRDVIAVIEEEPANG